MSWELFGIALVIALFSAVAIKLIFNTTISIKEAAIHFAAFVVVTLLISLFSSMSIGNDVEIWNGEISNKFPVTKDCPSGWNSSTDNFCTEYITRIVQTGQTCTTDSEGRQTCVPVYSTEYSYIYDWERRWFVEAKNINASWEISRVDRQGVNPHPFWTKVQVGEPASKTNRYKNWVAAASDSLFHEDGDAEEKYKNFLPKYPIELTDIWKANRVITVGLQRDTTKLNENLSIVLKDLGPKRQMNAVIVLVDANKMSLDYSYAVRRYWQGFKKNDAVIFIGLKENLIEWASVMSWSKNSMFDVSLREDILENRYKPLNEENLIARIHDNGMKYYERRSMKEFEFLRDQIPTPTWAIVTLIMLQLIVAIGGAYIFHNNDI